MPNRDRTQSIESRPAPRRSESSVSQTQPAIKVVGFRVEGAAPSPSPPSTLLADSQRIEGSVISGSPNPVIIPPSFQVGLSHHTSTLTNTAKPPCQCAALQSPTGLPACRLTRQFNRQQTGEAGMHPCLLMRPSCGKGLLLCWFQPVFQIAVTCRCYTSARILCLA